MASWKVHSKGHFVTAQVLRIESLFGLTFKQFSQTLSFFFPRSTVLVVDFSDFSAETSRKVMSSCQGLLENSRIGKQEYGVHIWRPGMSRFW
jgi:hypothetical protein